MPEIEDQHSRGKEMLQEVALHYAAQHGLRPERVEWLEQGGDEWWLKLTTEQHAVRVVFSADEIEEFASGDAGAASSKGKIRNAFASLAM